MSTRVFKIGRSTRLYSAPRQPIWRGGSVAAALRVTYSQMPSRGGGNERSDHHADPCLTARGVTAVGVKVFTSDLHGIQEDSRAQLHVKIRR